MGNQPSKRIGALFFYPVNHYELVIRTSKMLENTLTNSFGAKGHGLGQKLKSTKGLPGNILEKGLSLSKARNALAHEHNVKTVCRANVIRDYEEVANYLLAIQKIQQSDEFKTIKGNSDLKGLSDFEIAGKLKKSRKYSYDI